MTITLTITTGNAAFDEDPYGEIGRIIREAAEKIEEGAGGFPLLDVNGNTVGKVTITGKA